MGAERIERCFAALAGQRAALIAYLCVGDPSVEETIALAEAALEAGADLLELGVPFSDPTADGPVIAAASHRALRQGGSLRAALSVAAALRAQTEAPLVLFTYYNPVFAFGPAELPRAAREAGVDALLLVDLPPDEGAELRAAARAEALAVVPLIAPTSGPERALAATRGASGFVYYVSTTGVTGTGTAPLVEAGRAARALSERVGLPVAVGFGIDTPEKAAQVAAEGAAGVVVGTALVRAIAGGVDRDARLGAVRALVASLRRALDAR